MAYKFVKHDGGRSTSNKPVLKNDCTVRALKLVTGLKYDTCYEILSQAGREDGDGFRLVTWFKRINYSFKGFRIQQHSFSVAEKKQK